MKYSVHLRRAGAICAFAALAIGLASCIERSSGTGKTGSVGKIVESKTIGEKSGMTYLISQPEKSEDGTIAADIDELIQETEAMLAGLAERTRSNMKELPPVTITYLGKGNTLTRDPVQPVAEPDEKFNDETDGDRRTAQKSFVTSFTAIKPQTRNSFELGLPARLRSLTLKDAEVRKQTVALTGELGGRVSEKVEPNKPGKLVPQGWSLNDDNRRRLRGVNQRVTTWPWRTIVQFNYGGGNSGCSGSLIGPRHVVTAAHCIIAAGTDDYFAFTVSSGRGGNQWTGQSNMPGCPNSATQNCPSVGATYWYFVPSQWRASSTSNREQYDFGVIVIPNRLGNTVGWMGYWYAPINSLNTVNKYSRGYPSCAAPNRIDDPADPLACATCSTDLTVCNPQHLYGDGARCSIGNATNVDSSGYNRNFRMSCDGSAGMSGSPLYFYGNGNVGNSGSVYYTAHDIQSTCGGTANSSSCANVTRADRLVRNTPEYSGWISYFRSTFP